MSPQEYLPTDPGGTLDTPKEAGAGVKGQVTFWRLQIELASKKEHDWRDSARKMWERYRNDPMPGEGAYSLKKAGRNRFNILYANVQTRAPALYNSTPIPDVRRRFRDTDPVAKVAAQVLERGLTYTLDAYDFDHVMKMAVLDEEVAGRSVSRVRYTPTFKQSTDPEGKPYQEVVDESVSCEPVQWDDFRLGPGRTWQTVTWVAFQHFPTLQEAEKQFGTKARKVPLDYQDQSEHKQDGREESDPNVLRRMRIWEVWDKTSRKVYWFAPSWPDDFLKVEDDYLNLLGFFPVPRPMYAIETPVTTVPVERYRQYQEQAEELDRITRRIMVLVSAMKIRGAYDGRIQEMSRVLQGQDNDLIPITTEGLQEALQDAGWADLSKAVWLLPIETIAIVVEKLYLYRQQIIEIIYQIDGTADIMRGQTDPDETLGAQQIKSQWGSLRITDAQKEVQRYARDLIRLQGEVMAEKFSPQTLAAMTSIKLPTQAEKQQAEMLAVQMQGQQQPIPGMGNNGGPPMDDGIQQALASPTWEEVIALLRSDMLRGFRVDIETDSTIQNDIAKLQQNIGGFLQGFASFVQAVGPALEGGFMTMETATTLFKAFAQSFNLGKQAEDAIDAMAENPPQPKTEPDPMQIAQMEMQADQQKAQVDAQINREKVQGQMALEQQKLAGEMQMEQQRMAADMEIEQLRFAVDAQLKREDAQIDRQIRQETAQQDAAIAERNAQQQARIAEQKAKQQAGKPNGRAR